MIKNYLRGFGALFLAIVPLFAATPAQAAQAPQSQRAAEVTTLADAVGLVTVVDEDRTGYTRSSFRHWNSGDLADGCNTRNEVLLAEAVTAPAVAPGCKLTGGSWLSYYDGQEVTDPGALDIDHMVPLAEAWDSGASAWAAARREAYANDQGAAASLVAVTARTNRQKADQDPAQWLPPAPDAQCRYVGEWVATKLRWQLTVDATELEALKVVAEGPCEDSIVSYTPAP
ncbi:HNH endonuclease family protein [[Kitasatospora] papulosa]|uniref:HNH endonuclease family protein n=1 Tax=[Kitasatospora] papulosa TaxID=1464011 RepID=UPI003699D486